MTRYLLSFTFLLSLGLCACSLGSADLPYDTNPVVDGQCNMACSDAAGLACTFGGDSLTAAGTCDCFGCEQAADTTDAAGCTESCTARGCASGGLSGGGAVCDCYECPAPAAP